MRTTDLHYRGETSHTRQRVLFETYTNYISYKKEPLKHQLHLRRNSDQGQTVATSEDMIADGRQRSRQEHFA